MISLQRKLRCVVSPSLFVAAAIRYPARDSSTPESKRDDSKLPRFSVYVLYPPSQIIAHDDVYYITSAI